VKIEEPNSISKNKDKYRSTKYKDRDYSVDSVNKSYNLDPILNIKLPNKKASRERKDRSLSNDKANRITTNNISNNINNLVVYNINIQPQQQDEMVPKNKQIIYSAMEVDENIEEALKFIKLIPNVEMFDRPKRSIPLRDLNDDRFTLILDLDETLVHSSIEPQNNPDDVFLIEMNDVK